MDGHEDPGKDVAAYAYSDRPEVPLLLSSHLPFEESLFGGRPVVFLLRNPLDVLVSNYFQKTRQDFTWAGDLHAFVRDPEVGTVDLVRYLDRWSDRLARPEVLVVTYEDLRTEPERGLIRIASHLGIRCRAAEAAAALELASFPNMLAVELRTGIRGYEYDRRDPEARRVRRGRIGGYRGYLDAADVSHVEAVFAERASPATRAAVARYGVAPRSSGLVAELGELVADDRRDGGLLLGAERRPPAAVLAEANEAAGPALGLGDALERVARDDLAEHPLGHRHLEHLEDPSELVLGPAPQVLVADEHAPVRVVRLVDALDDLGAIEPDRRLPGEERRAPLGSDAEVVGVPGARQVGVEPGLDDVAPVAEEEDQPRLGNEGDQQVGDL